GWSMKADRDASLVMDARMLAACRRGKADTLLHHSDQGSQHTDEQFQRLLLAHGIICPMSRAGNVRDNSAMETTAAAMQPQPMCSTTSSASTIRGRRHSKPGHLSPVAFEVRAMQTLPGVHQPGQVQERFSVRRA
ncbi:Integrase core domain-containing protein, partial [Palleronia marisminoris]